MSRKACLLTQNDVPQYIKEIVQRLRPVLIQLRTKMEIGGDIHSDLMPNGNVGMNHNYKAIVKNYLNGVKVGMLMQN